MKLDMNKLLHKGQKEIVLNLKRFTIIIAGRRFGKTRLASIILLAKAGRAARAIQYGEESALPKDTGTVWAWSKGTARQARKITT